MIGSALASDGNLSQMATVERGSALGQEFFLSIGLWGLAIFIFVSSFLFARIFQKFIAYRLGNKYKYTLHQEVLLLIERTVYFIVILVGFFVGLSVARVDIQWVLGALSLGLGFAFKDLLANVIAGVVILTQKKFKLDDCVQIGDISGKISSINIRTTEVLDYDGNDHIIPNSKMLTDVVKNYTSKELRRISFDVGIHYDTPIKSAIEAAEKALKAHPQVMPDPKPDIIAVEFGESAIILRVRFWIESFGNFPVIQSEVIQLLKQSFDASHIKIPFPIRTLTLDSHDQNILGLVNK
jgi:small conductance mechanosensitive channel